MNAHAPARSSVARLMIDHPGWVASTDGRVQRAFRRSPTTTPHSFDDEHRPNGDGMQEVAGTQHVVERALPTEGAAAHPPSTKADTVLIGAVRWRRSAAR